MPSVRNQKRKSIRGQDPKGKGEKATKVLEEISNSTNSVTIQKAQANNKDGKEVNERSFQLFVDPKAQPSTQENPELSLRIEHKQNGRGKSRSEVLNSGDFVLIMGPNSSGFDQNYVAKILSFYQNHFTKEMHASIQWFYFKDEIPPRLLPADMHENELLVDVAKNTGSIDVESILDKCIVKWVPPDGPEKKQFGKNEFFYRKSFNGKKVVDVLSPETDNSLQLSKAEQRNSILSPKRIARTPSKFMQYDEEATTTKAQNSSHKLKRKKSHKKNVSHSPNKEKQSRVKKSGIEETQINHTSSHRSANKSSKKMSNEPPPKIATQHIGTPTKDPHCQIENELLTSPVAASGYGKLDASLVALNILNSDGKDDSGDDDISVSSRSSKSSEFQSTKTSAPKSARKKSIANKRNTHQRTEAAEKKEVNKNVENKQISPGRLVISIPKTKLPHLVVSKLKSETVSAVRSSPRRKSAVNIVKESSDLKESDDTSRFSEDNGSESEYESDKSESSSDDSYVIPSRTPSRRAPLTPKSAKRVRINDKKTTVTPILIKMPRDKLPFIPARPTPVRSAKGKLEKSREKLHVSAVPECLPCRENEFQEIYTFVEGKLRSGGGGCMYVSGVPGTGKTATVREVMNALRLSAEEGDLSEFTYVDINGMRLTEPRQAYVQLLLQLTKQKATPDHAASLLTKLFSQRRKTSTVVLADELDLLWTKKQDVLYHLFDWPTHRHARLIVVAIANTMDLPERILMNRVASRLGLTRLTFRPYTFKQLQEIVASRLDGLDTFESDAVQLASRKVAAVSGDARRCLDICRRATEIAERKNCKIVGIEHVHSALQEMFATPMIRAICSCSKHEQLFLHAVVAEFRRSGMEEATLGRIIEQHTAISQLEGAAPVSVMTLVKISQRLASSRLILLEGGHRDLFSRIRLNVSVDDVLFSLKQ